MSTILIQENHRFLRCLRIIGEKCDNVGIFGLRLTIRLPSSFFFFFFLNNCYAENFNLFELYKVYVTFNSCFVFQSFSSGSVAKWQNLGTSFPRILIVGSHLN